MALPVRPDQLSRAAMRVSAPLSSTDPVPVAGEPLGGTSCEPERVTVYSFVGVSWARISPPGKVALWMFT